MKRFILLLALFTACSLYAQVVFNEKGKCGYQDASGQLVIGYQYDFIGDFNEYGIALMKQGAKWGMISQDGVVKVPAKYDEIGPFEQGAAYLVAGKKYGLLGEQGAVLCEPQFEFIYKPNSNGVRIAVKKRNKKAQKEFDHTHTYTLLNKEGKLIFTPILGSSIATYDVDEPDQIAHSFYRREIKDTVDTRAGYVVLYMTKSSITYDLEGNVVIDDSDRDRILQEVYGAKAKAKNRVFTLGNIEYLPVNNIVAFLYNQKGKGKSINVVYGYYNMQTKKLLRYYTSTWTKGSGAFASYKPDESIILKAFSEGFAVANIDQTGNSRTELINEEGEVVKTFPLGGCFPYKNGYAIAKNENNKWGLLDKEQKQVIPYRYDGISQEVNGTNDFPFICVAEDNKWGTVSLNNKVIIPIEFTDVLSYKNSTVVLVKKKKLWGAYDKDKKALECNYDSLHHFTKGAVLCMEDGKASVYNFAAKKMSEKADGYANVYKADDELHNGTFWQLYQVKNETDTVYGFIDGKAELVVPFVFYNDASAYRAYKFYRDKPTQLFDDLETYRLYLRFSTRERTYTLDAIVPDNHWDF